MILHLKSNPFENKGLPVGVMRVTVNGQAFYFIHKQGCDLHETLSAKEVNLDPKDFIICAEDDYQEYTTGKFYGRTNRSEILQTFEEYCKNPYLRLR